MAHFYISIFECHLLGKHFHMSYSCLVKFVHHKKVHRSAGMHLPYIPRRVIRIIWSSDAALRIFYFTGGWGQFFGVFSPPPNLGTTGEQHNPLGYQKRVIHITCN